ncbi:MAG: transglycosylase SLT domain-containing protein [Calditrichaeota bacterium]|nr:transglycosylase SLT domain-containing protein [Calditrichota bacterium]
MIRRIILCGLVSIFLLHPVLTADTRIADREDLHFVHDTNLFPVPKALEPQVNFWVNVYSKYSLNQHVIHDSRNLSVIYEVFDIRDAVGNRKVSYRTMRRYVKRRVRHWKSILRQLASHRTNFNHLKGDQKKAFEAWGEKRDHSLYRAASRRVRAQRGQKERFRKGVQLSGRYLIYMKKVFRDMGLPEGLTAIPHVESSFNYQAYSKVGAAGIWQFTRHTGRLFLKISYEVDERLDPILATHAAAELLQKNYNELGNWPLAITAYNHGLQGMKRAKRILHTDDIAVIVQKYRSRKFKFASRNFYTEFLAALKVVESYEKYLGPVIYDPPIQFQEFKLPAYISMSTFVHYFGLSKDVIRQFNPALRPPVYIDNKYLPKGYKLRLPKDINAAALFAKIPEKELHAQQKRLRWYRVRRGDTVGRIARRFRLRTSDIILANNIRNVRRIRVGSILYIPSRYETSRRTPFRKRVAVKRKKPVKAITEKADTLLTRTAIRKKAAPSPNVLVANNDSSNFYGPFLDEQPVPARASIDTVGRTLPTYEVRLIKHSAPVTGWIRVEPGETLGHYADWLGIPTQRVRRWNGLSYGQYLQIGQRIKLRFEAVSAADFEEKRLEYHRSIEEDFFQNYEIVGTQIHKVRRGENIWYLCNSVFDLPYWLVKSYNGNRNLFQLHPGDEIVIPKVESKNPDEEVSQSE